MIKAILLGTFLMNMGPLMAMEKREAENSMVSSHPSSPQYAKSTITWGSQKAGDFIVAHSGSLILACITADVGFFTHALRRQRNVQPYLWGLALLKSTLLGVYFYKEDIKKSRFIKP